MNELRDVSLWCAINREVIKCLRLEINSNEATDNIITFMPKMMSEVEIKDTLYACGMKNVGTVCEIAKALAGRIPAKEEYCKCKKTENEFPKLALSMLPRECV